MWRRQRIAWPSRGGPRTDPHGHKRRNDVAYLAKLMKAFARLTEALAQLRGERHQTIHVKREHVGESRSAIKKGDKEGG